MSYPTGAPSHDRYRPMPRTPWILSMRWHDLLFLHWPIRAGLIRPLISQEIQLDQFDGSCWLGIVPFRMSGVRLRNLPKSFPELNVRTYVKARGRSGVWFFSLDAANRWAVTAARCLGLPYYRARMNVRRAGMSVDYRSERIQKSSGDVILHALYVPSGLVVHAAPGSLEHWLTERYCLFAAVESRPVVYGAIDHAPWGLQPADAEVLCNTMTGPLGFKVPDIQPVCHFARYQEVVASPVKALK